MKLYISAYILFCTLTLLSSKAISQLKNSLTSFYPLQVGNVWQFDWRNGISNPPSHMYYEKWEILHDSIMSNGIRYYAFTSNIYPSVYYQRIDTSSGYVCAWVDPGHESIIYDLSHSNSSKFDTILGIPTCVLYAGPTDGVCGFAFGFGIISQENYGGGWPYRSTLIYAKINGKEFGTLVYAPNIVSQLYNFQLFQNYPNPFNPQTKISFSVPKESFITLKVYDVLGREVATLVQDKKQQGEYTVTWSANNVPSGVYFYKLSAGDFIQTKKMILMR
ncbi:MAG: T9SS type A sorting domain-containing protein [Ignavibacteriales bacterium]|nr:T9SS type A sorting domain-containing protein [Ignavibacteriales bacterium]